MKIDTVTNKRCDKQIIASGYGVKAEIPRQKEVKQTTKQNSHLIFINNSLTFLQDHFIMYLLQKFDVIDCKYIKTMSKERSIFSMDIKLVVEL